MLAVDGQQQQQQQVGFAWLLPALGTAATASCQFVCPPWAGPVDQQPSVQQHEQSLCQGPLGFSSRVLPHPAWAAGLPPLFAPPSQEQPDQGSPGHSVQASQTQRSGAVSRRKLGLYQPPRRRTPARRSWTREEDGWSTDSCDSFSEHSRAGTVQEDLSESNHSSQGSQQTSSSALEVGHSLAWQPSVRKASSHREKLGSKAHACLQQFTRGSSCMSSFALKQQAFEL